MMKQNNIAPVHFSATYKKSVFCNLFDVIRKGRYEGGFIKTIFVLFLVCCLQLVGCGNETSDNIKSTKFLNSNVNIPFDFAKVLESYSSYSSYEEDELFNSREAGELIELSLKNYNGASLKIPEDFECKIIVDDDYDTKGIEIIINLPFRSYAKPFDKDKHIKNVILNNSTGPFSWGACYVKCSYRDLLRVYGSTFDVSKDWKFYSSTYLKEDIYKTQLKIHYLDSEETMKELYKNREKYKIQVQIKKLSFSRPKTVGYFKLKDLLENEYNTTPLYNNDSSYIINKNSDKFLQNPPQKVLFAIVESVSIINNETKKVIVKLDFDSNCKVPSSLEMDNEIAFQDIPVENLSKVTIKSKPSVLSVLPKKDKNIEDYKQFDELEQYIDELNSNYEEADAFDKKKIKKEIEGFKNSLNQKEFQYNFSIDTVFIPDDFNKNEMRLFIDTPYGFRFEDNTSFNMNNIKKITLSDLNYLPYNMDKHRMCRLEDGALFQYYFYTSKKELAPLAGSRYANSDVRLEGGTLFFHEDPLTTVILDVVASVEDMKDVYNNYDDYEVVIVYNNLKQTQLPYYGFYNEEAFFMLNGNTKLLRLLELSTKKEHTPYYFITNVKKEDNPNSTPTIFTAKIKNIYVVNKKTKKVIAKADAKE